MGDALYLLLKLLGQAYNYDDVMDSFTLFLKYLSYFIEIFNRFQTFSYFFMCGSTMLKATGNGLTIEIYYMH